MKRRLGGHLFRGLTASLLTALLLPLCGCSSDQVRKVNMAAIASRASYTDDVSRLLAQKTLERLKDRSTDYRVGPEDVLEISIFEWELRDETRTVSMRIAESGIIALPVIGEVKVGGLTAEQVKDLLETRLKKDGILKIPRVSVVVTEFRSKRVAVVGAVHDPGVYTLRQNVTTLLAVLTLAGGVTERAGQVLYVVRAEEPPKPEGEESPPAEPGKRVIAVDLYELLEEGRLGLNVVLQNGDVVNVPEAKNFYVVGFVGRPGGFPLTRPTTVLEGIALAGGLREREASLRSCQLKRRGPEGEVIIPLDLISLSKGESPNPYLMPNDVIEVRQSTLKKIGLELLDVFKALFSIGYSLNP